MKKSFKKTGQAALFAVSLLLVSHFAIANYDEPITASKVNSIALRTEGSKLVWSVDGYSSQGFKVVWSKNENPTYPTREGDQYHYFAEAGKTSDSVDAFNGSGTYYVRVCEYLGGRCGVYSNQIKVALGERVTESGICTMEYAPVCGEKQVYCIKAPCPPIKTTYSNKCQLNNAKAKFLYAGECKKEEVKKVSETETLKRRVREMEQKIQKLEKENRRLFKLIKLREMEIETLKDSSNQ